uniref:Chitinase n=1 Tax=Tetranychus urticae TaxID=32264 RepID=T1KLX8_TETUR
MYIFSLQRTEHERTDCDDGHRYFCCPGPPLKPVKAEEQRCWWSSCQLKFWENRGCRADLEFKSSQPCPEGDLFECCETKERKQEEDIEPITGGSFENFVKYLLLKSHDFIATPTQLKCTQLDPDKSIIMQVGDDDGVRICDLCPNLPFLYLKDIFLDRIPSNTTSNVDFQDCFGLCEANSRCLSLSYDQESLKCYMFNSTVGIFTSDSNWKTILMSQPSGVLESWLYIRHTSISGHYHKIDQQTSFRDCLRACQLDKLCNHASYNLQSFECKMYSSVKTIDYIDLNYGWLTAFNLTDIPSEKLDVSWRFTRDENDLDKLASNTTLDNTCSGKHNETHSAYFSKDCFTSGAVGCDSITGCKKCYYPEATDELFSYKLQICPDSVMAKASRIADQVINRMVTCLSKDKCLGIGVNGLDESTEEILPELLTKEYQTRYMLRYPEKNIGLHRFLLRNDFLPDFDLMKSEMTQYYNEMSRGNLEDCLEEININDKITKISYSSITKICKVASDQVSMHNKPKQGLIAMVKHPDIWSNSAYYAAIYGIGLDKLKARWEIKSCEPDCEEKCSSYCSNELKDWCIFYTLTYEYGEAECHFYEYDDTLTLQAANVILYKKISTLDFNLESLDKLNFFQSDDIYGCFENSLNGGSTASVELKKTKNGVSLRRKRNIFKKIGNAFKKIGKGFVDGIKNTAKTIIDSGKGLVKAAGKFIKGDIKGAADAAMKIPIVKDIKTIGEAAGSLFKGDFKSFKKKGAEFLQSGTFDLLSMAIPGGGIAGKGLSIASKAIANTGKISKNAAKTGVKKLKTKDKITKDRSKSDQSKSKSKGEDNKKKDKDRDAEQRGSQCDVKNKHTKRATKRKRPGKDCDDDDKGNGACPRPVSNVHGPNLDPIIPSTTNDCRNRKVNAKCDFECEPGYEEVEPTITCKNIGKNKLDWMPKPECKLKDCAKTNQVLISLTTPKNKLGAVGTSKHVVVYSVLFNKRRKLPIWSIALHQSNVWQHKSYNEFFFKSRENRFKKYPCPSLVAYQANDLDYKDSGWHKGHLTPANIARWSHKATLSSNLYINAAPQDGRTNSGLWTQLEAHVQCFGKRKRIIVATGICHSSIGKTNTGGIDVPACFWKMLCYKDESSTEVVVGFIAENSKLNNKHDHAKRANVSLTPVSQARVLRMFKGRNPWISTIMELNKGREATIGADATVWLPVNPIACERARSLKDDEAAAWVAAFTKAESKLMRGKNTHSGKIKRESPPLDRGCHPDEFSETLSLIGLATSGSGIDVDRDTDTSRIVAENGDGSIKVAVQSCGKRIIGYYTSWGKRPITGIMMQRLTHVIFAFLEISSDGRVFIGSPDRKNSKDVDEELDRAKSRLEHLMSLRKIYPHVKVLFAVGGWENSQYFSKIAASSSMRNTFMTSIVKLISEWGFDGVDLDWEYPVTGGANEGMPADKMNYVILMKELRGLLDALADEVKRNDKYLISFAGAAGQWTLDPGFDLPGLLKYADFVNIMTYDYFGAWASKWGAYTGPPAPLYFGMPSRFSGKTNAAWTVKYYTCKTKLPHKLNMGVPFYGRYWKNVGDPVDGSDGMWRLAKAVNGKFEGDFVPWYKIESEYSTSNGYNVKFHEKSKTPYAWNPSTKIFLGFENQESLKYKVEYAVHKNVGGLMVWAIDLDDRNLTLLDIVSKAPLCKNTDPNKFDFICSPIDEKRWWTSEDGEDKAGLCGKSAPLYKGYYPVCDPDDPGYSCCGKFGYCGTGPDYCNCPTCKDFGKDPRKILEGAIKPSVPVTWYLLNDPDGKRGRCGRKIEKISGIYPTCNPDDDNSHCCSNGGYCGSTAEHCKCPGCIDFRKNPAYKYGPKMWWTLEDGASLGGSCGPKAPKINGKEAGCDPDSPTHKCCSPHGWCGAGPDFCACKGCKTYS